MTQEEIKQAVNDHPAHKVKLAITDIDGILRGKVVHKDKFMSIIDGGFGFCSVVFGWDAVDTAYDNAKYTGWHTGYPDSDAQLDLNTFRQIPWEENLPFFLGDFINKSGEGLAICPRSLLKKVKQQALDAGYVPQFSQEFEWFNFAETPETLKEKAYTNIEPLTPGMFGYSLSRSSLNSPFFNDLFDLLLQFDVPLEGLHTETGPGVYEAAILYGDILEAGDRAVLFKNSVKEIAYQHGVMATFMAKPNQQLPGCSGHIHQSLWDNDQQKNLFYDESADESMSSLMQSYVAGQLHCLPHILPMFAPTINSYKRLVEGAWAPTTLTWGTDNRTTALRVLAGGKKSTRLETRVPGSDVNPYLALAAALASGLYGIRHELKLDQPKTTGNGYEDDQYGVLPRNLWEASQAMKESDLATELFGADFVDHFVSTREWECRQYAQSVTDWEVKRYFEVI
ncbi:MAG: glutamine synthetase family protein [Tunicatimonas sp.]|uniref:glutamine synthetase family protein n=1 Tax=Tunicatimonas sp. TaxID=1940096 RepID=UPI003C727A3B